MIPPAEVKELNLKDYLEIIKKHTWLVLAIFISLTGLVIFYSLSSPKIYMARTSIVIEPEKPKIAASIEDIYKGETGTKDYFQTQINILTSRSLAERIVKNLNLDRDPEFIQSKDQTAQLLSMVTVEPVRLSNVANIYVKGRDPVKVTTIANVWIREFIYQDIERRVGTTKYGITFLENQLAETLTKLQESEKQLNDFIRTNKIVATPDIESKTEALLESLKEQRAQLEKQIAEASQKYKEKHPQMISLMSQLKAVENKLAEETNNRLSLQEKMTEYSMFKRKVDTYKSLYEDFLKRAKELDVSKELTISNIRVLDPAEEPKSPIKPKPQVEIPLAAAVSLILGIFLSLFIERLDTTIKTSDEIEFYVKFPFLGYIPSAKREAREKKNINLLAHLDPRSRLSESFRNLKVSLLFSFPQEKPLRTIVITSSIPAEGKSFVSTNLAIVFAQANEPALLIDADMRKGNLHQCFNIKSKSGLSTLLAGISPLEETIFPTSVPNLSMMPAGPYTPNPTELLSSERFPSILRELEKKFKRIIIDSTPILNISEALILGDKCDGIVYVIRAGYTSIKFIMEAKKIIAQRVKIIGATLNDIQLERDRYYYYHYYYPLPKEKK